MFAKHPENQDIPALRQLWQEAFGDDDAFLDRFFATGYSENRCRVVMRSGKAAAALYWFDCTCDGQKIAYIYAVATAEAYRGKGLCTALMNDTHRHLKENGFDGAILVPSSESLFGLYGKIGYRVCSTIDEICCTAAKESIELQRIDTEEYARLRRSFLPPGGVIQEGENLRYLEAGDCFYKGENFLLSAYRIGNTLYGSELLGNTDKASAIVKALDCAEGKFRIPGDGRPFAMYYSLSNKTTAMPSYFGLAFD